jgi:prepilin-type processing-associated H-X9-DG protein
LTRGLNGSASSSLRHWKQLEGYDSPKILVFVNDEHNLDIVDLVEAWNGFLYYGTEATGYIRNTASRKIAQGHIGQTKGKIDLYVWFDRHYGKGTHLGFADGRVEVRTEGPDFSCVSLEGYHLARRYFGCPEVEIPDHLKPAAAEP